MKRILWINDEQLTDCVMIYGPGTLNEREKLVQLLLARKEDIRVKYELLEEEVSLLNMVI